MAMRASRPSLPALAAALLLASIAPADEFDDLLSGGATGAQPQAAEPRLTFDFSGNVQGRFYLDLHEDNRDENLAAMRDLVFAQGIFGLSPRTSFLLSGLLEYRLDTNYDRVTTEFRPRLWEMYATLRLGPVDLQFGQQLVNWGVLDVLSPVNIVNPTDFAGTFFYLDEDYRRIPLPMARATWYFAPGFSLEGLWIPFFRPTEFDVSGGDWALLGPVFPAGLAKVYLDALLPYPDWERTVSMFFPDWEETAEDLGPLFQRAFENTEEPRPDDLSSSELGARMKGHVWYLDLGASYLYHWDDSPTLHITDGARTLVRFLLDPQSVGDDLLAVDPHEVLHPFSFEYHRLHSTGFELAFTYRDLALRGEALYQFRRHTYTRDLAVIERDQLTWSAAIEYTFPWDVLAIGQWLQVTYPAWDDTMLAEHFTNLVMLFLRKTFWRETLEVYLAGLYELTYATDEEWRCLDLFHEDFAFIPAATYKLTDDLTLRVGASVFGGKKYTLLGYLKENSQVFATVKYAF